MRTVSVVEQGALLRARQGLLLVESQGKTLKTIRPAQLDQLLLFGNVTLTPAAMNLLVRKGIDVVFLSLNGRFRARLFTHLSNNVQLRLDQMACAQDEPFAAALARQFVVGKLHNQRHLLLRAQRRLKTDSLAQAIARLRWLMNDARRTQQRDTLRGLEGAAAAVYFDHLGQLIRNPQFTFTTRTRRPPRDPVNAALSFGYALLLSTVQQAVFRCGLDPMVGFLHQPHFGRPSLVLDLMEEFRPMVDQLVLTLINRRQLAPADFRSPDQPPPEALLASHAPQPPFSTKEDSPPAVHLADSGRRILIAAFHQRLRVPILYPPRQARLPLREVLSAQVYLLADAIRNRQPSYSPFTWT